MPWALDASGEPNDTSRTSSAIVPASGVTEPAMTFISVDLPAPFSPSRAWTSPASTSKSTPVRACTPGYALLTSSRRRSGALLLATFAVSLDAFPVDFRELRGRVELIGVPLPDRPRTDVLRLRNFETAGEPDRVLGAEPAPLREPVVRLRDQLPLADRVGRLGRDVVREDRHRGRGRRGLAAGRVEDALALRGDHRAESHL